VARKKTQKPAEDALITVDAKPIEKASATLDSEGKRLAEIDAQFSTGEPYDMHRIIDEARFFLAQSANAMLEAGNRLVLLKEHETHGEFQAALEKVGIKPRPARKMMQAAVKFSGSKRPLAAVLSKSKILELMAEDDDDLQALADGETLAGHTLDDIDRMTRDELRESLRKARKERTDQDETTGRLLADKNKKIDELDSALSSKQKLPVDEQAQEIAKKLASETQSTIAYLLGLESLIKSVFDIEDAPGHLRDAAYHSVQQVRTALDDLQARYALTEQAPSADDDAWMHAE